MRAENDACSDAVGRRGGAVLRAGLGPETDRLKDTDDDDDDDASVSPHYA